MQESESNPSRPLTIGLTGGIASGKSTISSLFAEKGIVIIDADQIARDLFRPYSKHLNTLVKKFGKSVLSQPGVLDRAALRKLVFSDPAALEWLNEFTHPLVHQEILKQLSCAQSPYVILDIPLLIDRYGKLSVRFEPLIDRILVVDCKEDTQLSRLREQRGIDKAEALRILDSQASREARLRYADDIIENEDGLKALEQRVSELHNSYLQQTKY